MRVRCSKGTYIRVLGEDIGKALGCGAHLQALRRTAVGMLSLADAVTLESMADFPEEARVQQLAPVDALLSSFPAVRLDAELTRRFLHGQRIALGKEGVPIPGTEGRVRVVNDGDGRLLGTGLVAETGVLAPERLIANPV